MRGALVVFEGVEGAGKTTQLARLADRLGARGVPVRRFREPGGTALGDAIRALLLDPAREMRPRTEALLFMASRAELIEREVRPAVQGGTVVLLDRFFLATYAYQIHGRGLDEREVRAANAIATGGVVPDLTVLLRVDPAVGFARVDGRNGGAARDRIERAGDGFHRRVAEAFDQFESPGWQRAHPEVGPIAVVDGGGDADAVHAAVCAAVARALPDLAGAVAAPVG
jgi:dTMP kinase